MSALTRLFWAMTLALLTAFILAPPPALAQAVGPQGGHVISNVATIAWDGGGQRVTLASNRIDLTVERSSPLSLTAYRFATNSASEQFPVTAPLCTTTGGALQTAALAQAWAGQSLAPATALAISEIRPGEPFVFRVNSPADNLDAQAIDSIEVAIEALSGDREFLTVYETGPNTGQFSGFLQTTRSPPPGDRDDCRIAVEAGDLVTIATLAPDHRTTTARTELRVLADPFGYVFDSADGTVLSGVRVTLVDATTGLPAEVFGDDGASRYPSTVTTGTTVLDSGGSSYSLAPGQFRFPLTVAGTYRLVVEPPDGYFAPSVRSPADLAHLRQPGGQPFAIDAQGSYGGIFALSDPEPVQISIPLDRPGAALVLTKVASSAVAEPGTALRYRITVRNPDAQRPTGPITVLDALPASLRLRPDSVRIDDRPATLEPDPSGRGFRLILPSLAPSSTATITYAVEVRPDARPGDAVNRAEASDDRGNHSNTADAVVRIRRDTIAARMTIIGRVVDGRCDAEGDAPGVAGVRIMLEDGSYAVTDEDGRYHFEGVQPGTHVVQLDDMTLPADRVAVDCALNTRSAGRAFSRFVDGRGGALKRVDFHVVPSEPRQTPGQTAVPVRPTPPSDAAAAGAERDWLTGETPGIAWLFPEVDHNPRAPLVRVAIKHLPGQTVHLFAGGRPVDQIAFDGTVTDGAGTVSVSVWRGIPIDGRSVALTAEVRDASGAVVETLSRTIRYGSAPIRAQLLRDQSVLVADGVTRPIIAIRLTDRDGRPVRHGVTGDFELPAPYYPAVEADAQQARQLAGLERARPFWRIQGEDGVAYIELEPTTASGSVSLRFKFQDERTQREQRLETWLEPGARPWTIVGLAEGTVGFNRLQGKVETLDQDDDDIIVDGRVALYAKGRVSGKWLITLAYDSDKDEDETRFAGVIDPDTYYTVYADRSERRYDAASLRRLYLKLERPQFYALFGDYETGIDEPELARYVRAFNGVKTEYRSDQLAAVAFAADTPTRHRRYEMQGNGLSGPYVLGARDIFANSERISIEVRDRLRSDMVIGRRLLTRHIDYDIDYLAGTLRFREPILSRDSNLNPQFIIADYEVDGVGGRELNAGGRVAWHTADETLQVAATAIRDADSVRKSTLIGADVRYRPTASTEIRAEAALSDSSGGPQATSATAWQVEAEHHDGAIDVLAYVRQRERGFGLGQTTAAEDGTRKVGVDAAVRIGERWNLSGSAWHDDYLASDARRTAARVLAEYRGTKLDARAGLTWADDRLEDGREARSTLLQLGATQRLFDNRLELDAQTELPLGSAESIDFPARHRLAARFAATSSVALVGSYEIADGDTIDARTARLGFDLQPWTGARIALSGNVQDIAEYGPRTFAAFGLSQSLVLDEHWSVDLTLDSNRTVDGIDPARVLNPAHPVASGGYLGSGGLTEDFVATTAGATYRNGDWSVTGRAEYRAGDRDDRYGVTAAALRQIGEGSALGASFDWFTAKAPGGAETRATSLQLSWAHRPADSRWSWLDKLELRDDRVTGAAAGELGPLGSTFTISGDARSSRIVNSLSINFSDRPRSGGRGYEMSLFWGSRYASERLEIYDVAGWSNVVGFDLRYDLAKSIDVSLAGTVRHGAGASATSWSAGPGIGFSPVKNSFITVGWNVAGFRDRDFEEARYTRSGPYLQMRFKFDQLSLQELGLGRR